MNATILPFKRVQKPSRSGLWEPKGNCPFDGSIPFLGLPAENPGHSLEEMCATLRKNYAVLDETDRSFLFLITRVCNMGNRAKIETVMGCRAFAWSMLGRYKLPC